MSHLFEQLFKKTRDKCWRGCGENETCIYYWWECKLVQPLWKTIWRFFKKLKTYLPYNSAIPLLGIQPKEMKTGYQRNICTFMFIATSFIIVLVWKQHKCPSVDEWINKMWYTYTIEYAAIKKELCYRMLQQIGRAHV